MKQSLEKLLQGYQEFRSQYALGKHSMMQQLSQNGQNPQAMVVACCDSRVDPALILQCDPGDLFVVRNVANIVPPYEKDGAHHGTSAALEFGICFLKVKHLILLGHSQCGGIQSLLNNKVEKDDFISSWMSLVQVAACNPQNVDDCAKAALRHSYDNCMRFPWIKEKVANGDLIIHLWFFDIKKGQIFKYSDADKSYTEL
jgi:carbonic anhydrase